MNRRETGSDAFAVSTRSHVALAFGNILRVLMLFHLPLVIFSTYQLSLARTTATKASVILAAFVLVLLGVALPLILALRLRRLSPDQREDRTTMLALGPFYTLYADASGTYVTMRFALSVIIGVVVGGGQGSGTAQAVIILVVEILDTLVTTLLLPWGEGAAMGPLAFVVSVVRIIIAVLLVVMSPGACEPSRSH